MEAADRVDSTVGLQMAYLKQWAPRAYNDLALRLPVLLPQPAAGACRRNVLPQPAAEACQRSPLPEPATGARYRNLLLKPVT